jgi:EpsI family protein
MQKEILAPLIAAILMTITAASASHLRPTRYMAETRQGQKLESMVPRQFGRWKQLELSTGIVNPQQEQLLSELYSDQLTRSYVSPEGYRIMLSIAYGKNQNDSFQVHLPEICYPAQGFQVNAANKLTLNTPFGDVPAKRLETTYQSQRVEPVTYWTTIGDQATGSSVDKKLKEMEYAMKGLIADGLLFRVSSVDTNIPRAYDIQGQFINELLSAIPAKDRLRLAGLSR